MVSVSKESKRLGAEEATKIVMRFLDELAMTNPRLDAYVMIRSAARRGGAWVVHVDTGAAVPSVMEFIVDASTGRIRRYSAVSRNVSRRARRLGMSLG